MSHARLRIYHGPAVDEEGRSAGAEGVTRTITLPLGDVLPLLADAVQSQRTWVRDFEDDPITITSDLYEVILAYQHFRRPSA